MTEEQGKPLRASRIEVQYAADFFVGLLVKLRA